MKNAVRQLKKERLPAAPFAVCALRLLLHKHGGDEQRGETRDDGRSRTGRQP